MRDLISRYEAIEAIDKILPTDPIENEYTKGKIVGVALALKYVMQLPSAQPEESLMTAKAILEPEEIEKIIYKTKNTPTMVLPSTQPEIVKCKDCIKREICRTTNIWAVAPDDDWFCANAERRTDE